MAGVEMPPQRKAHILNSSSIISSSMPSRLPTPFPIGVKLIPYNFIQLDTEQEQAVGPFLTHELIRQSGRELSVVVDISCDTLNPLNPLPIYSQPTTFTHPTVCTLKSHSIFSRPDSSTLCRLESLNRAAV